MPRRFVASGVAHPNVPRTGAYTAYLTNDERERAAKGFSGLVLLHEHDRRKSIGRVLRGYVPKEGRHKDAIIAEFEVTDPEYQDKIINGELRELSIGQVTEEFKSDIIGTGVGKTTIEELSVVEKGAMSHGPVITDFTVIEDDGSVYRKVLASMKKGDLYVPRSHNVQDATPEKIMTDAPAVPSIPPTTSAVSAPAVSAPAVSAPAVSTPAASIPSPAAPVAVTPAGSIPTPAAPVAVPPAASIPAPAASIPAPAAPAVDGAEAEMAAVLERMVTEARARGITLTDYMSSLDSDRQIAEQARIQKEKEEAEARRRQAELLAEIRRNEIQAIHASALNDPSFRTIKRDLSDLRALEQRYVANELTSADLDVVQQMVAASKRAKETAPAAIGFDEYTKRMREEQLTTAQKVARDVLKAMPEKTAIQPVGVVTSEFQIKESAPMQAQKRPLPPTVTKVTASAKRMHAMPTSFDVSPNEDLDWGVYAPTDPETMAQERELAKETRVFASAKKGIYDDSPPPEEAPADYVHAYGMIGAQHVWASARTARTVKRDLPADIKRELTRVPLKPPTPTMTKRDSILVGGNPALVHLMENYPAVFNMLRSMDAPRNPLEAYDDPNGTVNPRAQMLSSEDTPDRQQAVRASAKPVYGWTHGGKPVVHGQSYEYPRGGIYKF